MRSLATILDQFMARRADPLQKKLLELWRQWDELFGPLAKEIVPLGHKKSTLTLGAFSSVALQEFRHYADQILEPVNSFLEEPVFNTIRLELINGRTPLNNLYMRQTVIPLSSKPVPNQIGQLDLPPESPVGRAYIRYFEYVKKQRARDKK